MPPNTQHPQHRGKNAQKLTRRRDTIMFSGEHHQSQNCARCIWCGETFAEMVKINRVDPTQQSSTQQTMDNNFFWRPVRKKPSGRLPKMGGEFSQKSCADRWTNVINSESECLTKNHCKKKWCIDCNDKKCGYKQDCWFPKTITTTDPCRKGVCTKHNCATQH